jgi:hypothetical protein
MLRSSTLRCGKASRLQVGQVPMLACPLHKSASSRELRKLPPGPYFVSPKLDGIRCVWNKDGAFTRRRHKLHGLRHIAQVLKPVFKLDPTLVLDGELYSRALARQPGGFEKVMSVVTSLRQKQRQPTSDRDRSTTTLADFAKMEYHVFDVQRMNATNSKSKQLPRVIPRSSPFPDRLVGLICLFRHPSLRTATQRQVVMVPHRKVANIHGARRELRYNLQRGVEGAVMRAQSNKYVPGKRSDTMIKLVPWHDTEYRVLRLIIGHRPVAAVSRKLSPKRSTRSKATVKSKSKQQNKGVATNPKRRLTVKMVECITKNGTVFRAHVGVSHEVRQEWMKTAARSPKGYLGVYATVRYPRLTPRGVPRFGVVKAMRGRSGQWFL